MSQQGRRKHIPQRTCVVCRETNAKRTLTRIVRTADQGVLVDPTGKRNGRGAYLCSQPSCWQTAVESSVLEKALRTTLTIDDRQRLREAMTRIVDVGHPVS
jgi:predicted RNA-binding protein YlxR (DUF448 family)